MSCEYCFEFDCQNDCAHAKDVISLCQQNTRLVRENEELQVAKDALVKALKAQLQMRDMKKPTKLEESICWRDNDELAAKWADEALALASSAGSGEGA